MTKSLQVSIFAGATLLLAGPTLADWTSDPSVNTTMVAAANDQNQNITRVAPDGSLWMSYMDNSAGSGYKPTMQRFSACGLPLIAGNGVVMANRTNTATFTYDMKVGADGSAYCVFDNSGIFLQKVNPDGTLAFGANGVAMPTMASLLGARLAIAADGTVVVACGGSGSSGTIFFQRVNPNGTLGNAWTHVEASRAQVMSDLVSGNNAGDVIALWVRAEGTNSVTSRKGLKLQKYSSSNAGQWNGGVPIDVLISSTSRGLSTAYFPSITPDGSNGVIVAWFDGGTDRNAFVQHYSAAGVARFPQNGIAISVTPGTSEYRLSASVGYDAPSESYVVAYQRSNPVQSQFGLGAQYLKWDGVSGSLQWGSGAGSTILPTTATTFQSSFVNCQRMPGGDSIITWIRFNGANTPVFIESTRLDSFGVPVWETPILVAATNPTGKSRLTVNTMTTSPSVLAVWGDGATGNADLKAQLINYDGTLGRTCAPATCLADVASDSLDTTRNPNGSVGAEDLDAFIGGFIAANAAIADVASDSLDTTFNPNGSVGSEDLDAFIGAFIRGC